MGMVTTDKSCEVLISRWEGHLSFSTGSWTVLVPCLDILFIFFLVWKLHQFCILSSDLLNLKVSLLYSPAERSAWLLMTEALSRLSPLGGQKNTHSFYKNCTEYLIACKIYPKFVKPCFKAWAPKSLNTDRRIQTHSHSWPYLTPSGECFEQAPMLILLFLIKHTKVWLNWQ